MQYILNQRKNNNFLFAKSVSDKILASKIDIHSNYLETDIKTNISIRYETIN